MVAPDAREETVARDAAGGWWCAAGAGPRGSNCAAWAWCAAVPCSLHGGEQQVGILIIAGRPAMNASASLSSVIARANLRSAGRRRRPRSGKGR